MKVSDYLGAGFVVFAGVLLALPASAQERPTLTVTEVRRLDCRRPPYPGGPRFLAAASGLVKRGRRFYVVADDAQTLGWFSGTEPVRQLALLHRPPLPTDSHLRGSIKPDFESLTWLRAGSTLGLLALCSGSGDRRNAGAFVSVDESGVLGKPVEIDLTPLYHALCQQFSELNIEGVSVLGNRVRLLQRGNSGSNPNAVIDIKLDDLEKAIKSGGSVPSSALLEVTMVDLGTVEGPRRPVRWTFTDLCPLGEGRALFTAAAEDTDNPYEDGEVLGSAVGLLEPDATVSAFFRVDRCVKLEGLAVDGDTIYAVTDADDPDAAATLYQMKMPAVFRQASGWGTP